jgi:hypothetical protein
LVPSCSIMYWEEHVMFVTHYLTTRVSATI